MRQGRGGPAMSLAWLTMCVYQTKTSSLKEKYSRGNSRDNRSNQAACHARAFMLTALHCAAVTVRLLLSGHMTHIAPKTGSNTPGNMGKRGVVPPARGQRQLLHATWAPTAAAAGSAQTLAGLAPPPRQSW